jgi:GNAT superfamily N-acetyltransferase
LLKALDRFWQVLPSAPRVLNHGDFCLENTLWHDGQVVTLLDGEIWRTMQAVTPDEWAQLKQHLRETYERVSAKPSEQSLITVVPAAPEHWPDIEELFARTPCWCQYWRQSAGEYGRISQGRLREHALAERKDALRGQLGRPAPPAVIAYVDGRLVGWCGLGPRSSMERLVRSRTIPAVDERPVWSIVCFLVRVGYRRRGVARALLRGAIDCARAHGAPALEAYPVDPAGRRIDVAFAYVGTLAMFEREGFRRVLETAARSAGLPRWLMRLEL